jgi:hypothetical protein
METLSHQNKKFLELKIPKFVQWENHKRRFPMGHEENKDYLEFDIGAAADLLCCGYRFLGVQKTPNGRPVIRLENHDGLAADRASEYKQTFRKLTEKVKGEPKRDIAMKMLTDELGIK